MFLPKPLRKFVAIFRGDVSPILILLSTLLGFWFGLTPGWYGVHVILLVLALVLNVHFGIFMMCAAVGRALAFAIAPVLYHFGQMMQDSAAPLFAAMGRVPVLGLTDFSRCAVAGGMVAGPVLGFLGGLAFARAVGLFRKTWLELNQKSEAFAAWQNKSWVRWLDWLLIGKRTKDVEASLKRRARLVRPVGIIVAVVVLGGAGAGLYAVQGDVMRDAVQHQLARANGAEVNIARFDLAPFSGMLTIGGLQVTDQRDPSRNRFAADELSAGVSIYDLLCGQLVIDSVKVANLQLDSSREQAGEVLVPVAAEAAEKEQKPFDPAAFGITPSGVARLQDYYKQGREIEQKLKQAAEWLPSKEATVEDIPADEPQGYLEFLTARTSRPPRPRVIIRKAEADDVALQYEEFGRSNIVCENLSDAPAAAGLPVVVSIQSKERPTQLRIAYDFSDDQRGAEITGRVEGMELAQLQNSLSDKNPVRFQGGTATAEINGRATREDIDLAIAVQTNGMQATTSGEGFFGLDPRVTDAAMKTLENVKTQLRLVGPTGAARLAFDVEGISAEMKDALVEAGQAELAGRLDTLLEKELGDKMPEGAPKADELLNTGKSALEGLLGGKKKPAEGEDEKDK